MQNLINMIVFLLVLGSIIIIHELGHFIAAKFFGVYCSQFSIGFGPKIWSKKGEETEYELRVLPFGGFVAMAGEEGQEDNEDMKDVPYERTLKGIKCYQKVIIFLAGVFMNFMLALIVLFSVNFTVGRLPVQMAQVGGIVENTPAEKYGLKENDIIQQVDIVETGQSILISNYDDIDFNQKTLNTTASSLTMNVIVKRGEEKVTIKMLVDYDKESEIYRLGITQATRKMDFTDSFFYTFIQFKTMSLAIFDAIKMLVTQFSKTVTQLSGPVGIYKITAEVTQTGQIVYIFNLLAMLSVNVGIFNLMPIPGLDGCQVLFALVEKIIGRELPEKLKFALQLVGLGLVMFLMIFVTYQDISRLLG